MTLKITTPDIQIEYQDGYSKIEADSKDRILEILEKVYAAQLSFEQVREINEQEDKTFKRKSQWTKVNKNK